MRPLPVRRTFLLVSLLVVTAAFAADGFESPGAGFVFVAGDKAIVRDIPGADGRVMGLPPTGMRLVYRKYLQVGNTRTWYFVDPPGGPKGWISAEQVTDKRADVPQPSKPIKLIESGLGNVKATARMTAAARGLDSRAKKFGEKQNQGVSVDQFLTFEELVEDQFQDEHYKDHSTWPDGSYPEFGAEAKRRNQLRRDSAALFKKAAGGKK